MQPCPPGGLAALAPLGVHMADKWARLPSCGNPTRRLLLGVSATMLGPKIAIISAKMLHLIVSNISLDLKPLLKFFSYAQQANGL